MKALKCLRVLVAACVFTLVTLFFLGLGGGFGLLERFQFLPALLGSAAFGLAFWVVVTLLFGRAYCSMFCPLGILQDILGRLVKLVWRRRRFAPRPDRPWVRFAALLVFAALFVAGGASLGGLLDPYSVFGRIATHLFQPAAEWLNNLLAAWLGTDGPVVLFRREIFVRGASGFAVAASSLGLLVLLVAWKGRLACNTICPVGAMLAAMSKRTAFGIVVDPAKCVKCGICSGACKALCLDGRNQVVDNARCVRCFNCVGACARGAISFAKTWKAAPAEAKVDGSLRAFVATGAASMAAFCAAIFSRGGALPVRRKPRTILPPGATLASLDAKCTACGLCMAKCPSKVIVPAGLSEYGATGFMMPRLDFSRGFCRPGCSACYEVCPTGATRAIPLLDPKVRPWVKLGLAELDRSRCLALAEKIPCGLCARRCPQKAITVKETVVKEGGGDVKVQMPSVDSAKCTGCGACENYCPSRAMRVESLRESSGPAPSRS